MIDRRQTLERGHNERREGEEDARYKPASQGCRQSRHVQEPAHLLQPQTPFERASSLSATRRPVLAVPT